MRHTFHGLLRASFALLLTAIPVLAHHTIAAEFDTRETVTLSGVFTKIDWINPHIYFYLDAKDDSGTVTKWAMESYPTGFFHRAGITRDLFKVGDMAEGWNQGGGGKTHAAHSRRASRSKWVLDLP
jgi:hypothetical protein